VPRITFLPAGVSVEVPPGTSVFNAAARAEVAIPSQCGGKCACALCRVRIVEGERYVSPMKWEEEGHMGNAYWITRERLSCQLAVFGDVVVEISGEPAREKRRGQYIPFALIRKREKMERDEELRRVSGGAQRGAGGRDGRGGREGREAASQPPLPPSPPQPPGESPLRGPPDESLLPPDGELQTSGFEEEFDEPEGSYAVGDGASAAAEPAPGTGRDADPGAGGAPSGARRRRRRRRGRGRPGAPGPAAGPAG
jgi:2Fe-2S ferredoxin